VVADFAALRLDQVGRDRVRISGNKGYPPPDTLKVSLNYLGGFRNSMTLVLTGLQVEEKADLVLRTVCGLSLADVRSVSATELAGRSTLDVRELTVDLVGGDHTDPASIGEAQSHLIITVKDGNPDKVGKAFTAPAVESALASYPGMFPTAPPGPAAPFGVFWPTTVPRDVVTVSLWTANPCPSRRSPGDRVRLDDGGFGVGNHRRRLGRALPRSLPRRPGVRGAQRRQGGTANVGCGSPTGRAEAVRWRRGVDALVVPRSAQRTSPVWADESPLRSCGCRRPQVRTVAGPGTRPKGVAFLIPGRRISHRIVLFPTCVPSTSRQGPARSG
jgi:hypothetical protein